MIGYIVKKTIKDHDKTEAASVRERYCVLSGTLGIICNLLLFAVKLTIGLLSGSIAIISDSFNNLSDGGSSVITVICSKLANKHPDASHPFGHGRMEYISSLFISIIVILVGFQLGKSSVESIISPSEVKLDILLLLILVFSLLVKLWLFYVNRYLGKAISSSLLLGVASDSINDVFATCAVIISSIFDSYVPFSLDGVTGTLVSIYILYTGISMAKNTIGQLLGTPPDPQTVERISEYVTACDEIVGIHDLIVHDYGPGRRMASVHAEVSDKCDIVKIHEIIDETEQRILNELGILIVIHTDPIATDDEYTCSLRTIVASEVYNIDSEFSVHDLRVVPGENRINVIFDLVVPQSFNDSLTEQLKDEVSKALKKHDSRLCAVINVEHKYC